MPESVGDVFLAVGAEDVEGEAAGSGKDARVYSDAAGVLQHRDVSDIVISVFNAPVVRTASDAFFALTGAEQT